MRKLSFTPALFLLIAVSMIQFACKKDDKKDNEEIIDPKSKPHLNPNLKYGTVTDIDGNKYATIEIGTSSSGNGRTTGSQIWMAENLRTSKYNDGTVIPNVKEANEWLNLSSGAWCYLENDPINNDLFGKLYNWHAVNTNKLCPKGWRVPSKSDWDELLEFVDAEDWDSQVGKLAAIGKRKDGTDFWTTIKDDGTYVEYAFATNQSGFSALPGGFRTGKHFNNHGRGIGTWWSTTKTSINRDEAYYFLISSGVCCGFYPSGSFDQGASCRCIKD